MHEQIELGLDSQASQNTTDHFICSTSNAPEEIYVTTEYNGKDPIIVHGPLEYHMENGKVIVRIGECVIASIYRMQTVINFKLFGGHSAVSLLNFLSEIRKDNDL
jgi:hypothetical protein